MKIPVLRFVLLVIMEILRLMSVYLVVKNVLLVLMIRFAIVVFLDIIISLLKTNVCLTFLLVLIWTIIMKFNTVKKFALNVVMGQLVLVVKII